MSAEEAGYRAYAHLVANYPKFSEEKERARRHQEVLDRWEAEQEWSRDYEQAVRP